MQESTDFADVIERAQRVTPGDVASPFASREAFVPNARGKVGTELNFNSHVKVFCLPTDAPDYEEVMDQILAGDAILRYEEKTFDKDGNFLVAICWLTERPQIAQPVNAAAGDAEPEPRPQRIP
jgi:hypothetical protein